jgi:hypothetical protein
MLLTCPFSVERMVSWSRARQSEKCSRAAGILAEINEAHARKKAHPSLALRAKVVSQE